MEIVALIHREGDLFGVVFPDMPGCVSVGDSHREVLDMGCEALLLHLQCMIEDGDLLPEPQTLDQLERGGHYKEELAHSFSAAIYSVDLSGKNPDVRVKTDHIPLHFTHSAAE